MPDSSDMVPAGFSKSFRPAKSTTPAMPTYAKRPAHVNRVSKAMRKAAGKK